jgi:AraC family transcriptional regulator
MQGRIRMLASGPGWRVRDIICTAGPGDRPFEEQHDSVCIAAVTEGTFQYRTTEGGGVLGPGAVLLGNAGRCFECGHEHGIGDRCLSFHYEPEYLEGIVAAVPGARRAGFPVSHLPPLPGMMPLLAAAEAAGAGGDREELEELALRLAGAAVTSAVADDHPRRRPSRRDERRITRAVRRIEAAADGRLELADLAREAAMSPYHFLRTFRDLVRMTPYQFVLRTRLHRAAVRLRRSGEPIAAIAFEAGFNDLSTFNRRFRHIFGVNPGSYRTGHSG